MLIDEGVNWGKEIAVKSSFNYSNACGCRVGVHSGILLATLIDGTFRPSEVP